MKNFFQLISVNAFTNLFADLPVLAAEMVKIDQACGRVTACSVKAPISLPPFARATMDGFAVRASDTFGCGEAAPALLNQVGEIKMGLLQETDRIQPGEAMAIPTGGALPVGADSVVMREYCRYLPAGAQVLVHRPAAPGQHLIQQGEECQVGDEIMPAGHWLRPQDVGVAAGLGITTLQLIKPPQVAIISTGNELVAPGEESPPGTIRDINSTTLAALVREAGGCPHCLGIVADDPQQLANRVQAACAAGADLVLISGGSSVGDQDCTLDVFQTHLGVKVHAHGVAIRPGKPTIFGTRGETAFFGLPGHVGSAIVVFYLLVRPFLRKVMGLPATHGLSRCIAQLTEPVAAAPGRETFIRVALRWQQGDELPWAQPIIGQSGLLKSLVISEGLLRIGQDQEGLLAGESAEVLYWPSR